MNKNFTKIIASITLVGFIFSSILAQPLLAVIDNAIVANKLNRIVDNLSIPYSTARITDAMYCGSSKIVINIQDLHCHPEVQKNISDLLSLLDKKYKLKKVYVEGAVGEVDTSWLEKVGDKKLKKQIADSLLGQGRLTGAEYYSIVSGKPNLLSGLEEKNSYTSNLQRLNKIIENREEVRSILDDMKLQFNPVKDRYYSRRQKKIESVIEKNTKGKIGTVKYYHLLKKYAHNLEININRYINIKLFLELETMQQKLKYKTISREISEYLIFLKNRLPYNVYRLLSERTENFSDISNLYNYLARISTEYQINVGRDYPELKIFFDYIDKSASINPLELINEENALKRELFSALCSNESSREIVFIAGFTDSLEKYLENRISAGEYDYLQSNLAKFRILWKKYNYGSELEKLNQYLTMLEEYYRVNGDRNSYFLKNIQGGLESMPCTADYLSSGIKHKENTLSSLNEAKEIFVTVTGGFHSSGVSRLLKDRNISYLVITPNVTRDTRFSEEVYNKLIEEQSRFLKGGGGSFNGIPNAEARREENVFVPNLKKISVGIKQFTNKLFNENTLGALLYSQYYLNDPGLAEFGKTLMQEGIKAEIINNNLRIKDLIESRDGTIDETINVIEEDINKELIPALERVKEANGIKNIKFIFKRIPDKTKKINKYYFWLIVTRSSSEQDGEDLAENLMFEYKPETGRAERIEESDENTEDNYKAFKWMREKYLENKGNEPERDQLFAINKELDEFVKSEKILDISVPFSEEIIKGIHKILINEEYFIWGTVLGRNELSEKEKGEYRVEDVFVRSDKMPGAAEIETLMEEFLEWLNANEHKKSVTLDFAAEAFLKFIKIHPFTDGNGRVGRFLVNLLLLRSNKIPMLEDRLDWHEKEIIEKWHIVELIVKSQKAAARILNREKEKNPWFEKIGRAARYFVPAAALYLAVILTEIVYGNKLIDESHLIMMPGIISVLKDRSNWINPDISPFRGKNTYQENTQMQDIIKWLEEDTVQDTERETYQQISENIKIEEIPAVKNNLLQARQVDYCIAHKNIVNPEGENIKGIDGASGPGIATTLLSFNAVELFCVDLLSLNASKLKQALSDLDSHNLDYRWSIYKAVSKRRKYFSWDLDDIENYFENLLIYELVLMGVDTSSINIDSNKDGNVVISFPWAYPGEDEKERKITYITADITEPASYPRELNDILQPNGIDFYNQKSGITVMHKFEKYIPVIIKAVRKSILITPTAVKYPDTYSYIDVGKILGNIKGTAFREINEINRKFEKYFSQSIAGKHSWKTELWIKLNEDPESVQVEGSKPLAIGSTMVRELFGVKIWKKYITKYAPSTEATIFQLFGTVFLSQYLVSGSLLEAPEIVAMSFMFVFPTNIVNRVRNIFNKQNIQPTGVQEKVKESSKPGNMDRYCTAVIHNSPHSFILPGGRLFIVYYDGPVRVYDFNENEDLSALLGTGINRLKYSDDGRYIFVYYKDNTHKLFDLAEKKEIEGPSAKGFREDQFNDGIPRKLVKYSKEAVDVLIGSDALKQFPSSDERMMLVSYKYNYYRLFDLEKWVEVEEFKGLNGQNVTNAQLSSDGKYVYLRLLENNWIWKIYDLDLIRQHVHNKEAVVEIGKNIEEIRKKEEDDIEAKSQAARKDEILSRLVRDAEGLLKESEVKDSLLINGIDISQIPAVKNGLIHPLQARYCIEYKNLINPDGKDIKGVYGASGPDILSPLLEFDPVELTCVDEQKINYYQLSGILRDYLKSEDIMSRHKDEIYRAVSERRIRNSWHMGDVWALSEKLLIYQLKLMGVPLKEVVIKKEGDSAIMEFPWAYPGQAPKRRKIVFIEADITQPEKYSQELNNIFKPNNIDFFCLKSAMNVMYKFEAFIPRIARSVRNCMLICPIAMDYVKDKFLDIDINAHLEKIPGVKFTNVPDINSNYENRFLQTLREKHKWYLELWVKKKERKLLSNNILNNLISLLRYEGEDEVEASLLDKQESEDVIRRLFPGRKIFIQNNRKAERRWQCSGDCLYCFAHTKFLVNRLKETEPMDLSEIGPIIDNAVKLGFNRIELNGEDSLDDMESFWKIVDACKSKWIKFMFFTNGVYLLENPDESLQFFRKLKEKIGAVEGISVMLSWDPERVKTELSNPVFHGSEEAVFRSMAQVIDNFRQVFPTDEDNTFDLGIYANDMGVSDKEEAQKVLQSFNEKIKNALIKYFDYTEYSKPYYLAPFSNIEFQTPEAVSIGISKGRINQQKYVKDFLNKLKNSKSTCSYQPFIDMSMGELSTCIRRQEYPRIKVESENLDKVLFSPFSTPRGRNLFYGDVESRREAFVKQLGFALALEKDLAEQKAVFFTQIESYIFSKESLMLKIEMLFLLDNILFMKPSGQKEGEELFGLKFVPAELIKVFMDREILSAYLDYYSEYAVSSPPSILSSNNLIDNYNIDPESTIDKLSILLRKEILLSLVAKGIVVMETGKNELEDFDTIGIEKEKEESKIADAFPRLPEETNEKDPADSTSIIVEGSEEKKDQDNRLSFGNIFISRTFMAAVRVIKYADPRSLIFGRSINKYVKNILEGNIEVNNIAPGLAGKDHLMIMSQFDESAQKRFKSIYEAGINAVVIAPLSGDIRKDRLINLSRDASLGKTIVHMGRELKYAELWLDRDSNIIYHEPAEGVEILPEQRRLWNARAGIYTAKWLKENDVAQKEIGLDAGKFNIDLLEMDDILANPELLGDGLENSPAFEKSVIIYKGIKESEGIAMPEGAALSSRFAGAVNKKGLLDWDKTSKNSFDIILDRSMSIEKELLLMEASLKIKTAVGVTGALPGVYETIEISQFRSNPELIAGYMKKHAQKGVDTFILSSLIEKKELVEILEAVKTARPGRVIFDCIVGGQDNPVGMEKDIVDIIKNHSADGVRLDLSGIKDKKSFDEVLKWIPILRRSIDKVNPEAMLVIIPPRGPEFQQDADRIIGETGSQKAFRYMPDEIPDDVPEGAWIEMSLRDYKTGGYMDFNGTENELRERFRKLTTSLRAGAVGFSIGIIEGQKGGEVSSTGYDIFDYFMSLINLRRNEISKNPINRYDKGRGTALNLKGEDIPDISAIRRELVKILREFDENETRENRISENYFAKQIHKSFASHNMYRKSSDEWRAVRHYVESTYGMAFNSINNNDMSRHNYSLVGFVRGLLEASAGKVLLKENIKFSDESNESTYLSSLIQAELLLDVDSNGLINIPLLWQDIAFVSVASNLLALNRLSELNGVLRSYAEFVNGNEFNLTDNPSGALLFMRMTSAYYKKTEGERDSKILDPEILSALENIASILATDNAVVKKLRKDMQLQYFNALNALTEGPDGVVPEKLLYSLKIQMEGLEKDIEQRVSVGMPEDLFLVEQYISAYIYLNRETSTDIVIQQVQEAVNVLNGAVKRADRIQQSVLIAELLFVLNLPINKVAKDFLEQLRNTSKDVMPVLYKHILGAA